MLAPATSVQGYEGAAYFANHVRFVWREHGIGYIATLHTFGQRATTELLARIVASLMPASRLTAVRQPPDSVPVGSGPDALAADATGVWGAVWTLGYGVTPDGQNLTPPELERVDPGTGRVTARLALGPGEATAVAVGAGSVWVALDGPYPRYSGTVLRIDPATMRPRARTPVGRGVAWLAVHGSSVWVVNAASNTVSRIDARTSRLLATVAVGHDPFALAAGWDSVWVTNAADGDVSRIDPRSGRVTATIPVGRAPYGIATDRHGVWVAVLGAGRLVRVDQNNNRVAARVNLGGDPAAIASDGRSLYVTINTDGRLVRLGSYK